MMETKDSWKRIRIECSAVWRRRLLQSMGLAADNGTNYVHMV